MAAAADRSGVLAPLLEQMLAEAARRELALVAAEHGVAAEEVRDLRADPARFEEPPRVSHVASRAVQRSFPASHHILGRLDVRDARILHPPPNLPGPG